MPNLLHLDSSADLTQSRTRAITAAFADAWTAISREHTITYRDLHRDALPHLADSALHWPEPDRRAGSTPPADAAALQSEILEELLAADALLVGAPMYNYSLPSTLKVWIDYIHVPGITTATDTAPAPLAGTPAVVVTASGLAYDDGSPTEGMDHAVPVLRIILGTNLGMDVEVIESRLTLAEIVPALSDQIDRSRTEFEAALAEAASAARRIGTQLA